MKRYWPAIWDVLFVAILPPLCFLFDPILFTELTSDIETSAYFLAIATYATVGGLILWFGVSRMTSHLWSDRARAFSSGAIGIGVLLPLVFGIPMLPLSLVAILLAGIGLLGLVPFVTSWRFYRLFRDLREGIDHNRFEMTFAGAVAVLLIPILVWVAMRPIARDLDALRGGDVTALARLDAHPLCRKNCGRAAFIALCPRLDGWDFRCMETDATAEEHFRSITGRTLIHYISRMELVIS